MLVGGGSKVPLKIPKRIERLVSSFGDSLGTCCIWEAIRASFHGIVAPSALEGPTSVFYWHGIPKLKVWLGV